MKPKESKKTVSTGPEENKALVRSLIDAINQQDWPRFDQLVAPDFLRQSSTFGQSQVRTRDELRDYLAGEFMAFPDAHERINFLVAEGDKVAVHSQFHGTQRGRMGSFEASGQVLTADLKHLTRGQWAHRGGLGRMGCPERPDPTGSFTAPIRLTLRLASRARFDRVAARMKG